MAKKTYPGTTKLTRLTPESKVEREDRSARDHEIIARVAEAAGRESIEKLSTKIKELQEAEQRTDTKIINGLIILRKYDGTGYGICTDHDVITAGPDEASEVSEEDTAELARLGWDPDHSSGRWCFWT